VVIAVQAVVFSLQPELWGKDTAAHSGPVKTMTGVTSIVCFGAAAVVAGALATGMNPDAAVYAGVFVIVAGIAHESFVGGNMPPPAAIIMNASLIILGLYRLIVADPYIPPACCWDKTQ